ncbi:hypothetical protein EK21DRAFT_17199, partial [Setomelanomma holmii]
VRFCFECSIWTSNEMEWDAHCQQHILRPSIIYGPVYTEGLLAAPRRCPYCMKDGHYLQMENTPQYLQHIESHIHSAMKDGALVCPHPGCPSSSFEVRDFKHHLDVVHAI